MKRENGSLRVRHLPRHLRLLEAGRSAGRERNARDPCARASGTSMKPVARLKCSCSANASISKRRRARARFGKRSSSLAAALSLARSSISPASRTIPLPLPAMTPLLLPIARSSCRPKSSTGPKMHKKGELPGTPSHPSRFARRSPSPDRSYAAAALYQELSRG